MTIQKNGQSQPATSVLGLLSLAVAQGTKLVLSATGPEAQQALEAVAMVCAGDEVAYTT
ncbi:MAG: HPr family phosphocarrier protein [Planctomycetota bacterium]|nr:HPr family phosphocarrier protein [Planctomycetota bacterium]